MKELISLDTLDQDAIADSLVGLVGQRKPGKLDPDSVIEAARSASHPLHGYFTWDNTQAAHLWRRSQATRVIQRVNMIWAGTAPKIIHAPNAHASRGQKILHLAAKPRAMAGNVPPPSRSDMTNPGRRVALLYRALDDLVVVRDRYESVPELSEVRIAIARYAKKIADVKRQAQSARERGC